HLLRPRASQSAGFIPGPFSGVGATAPRRAGRGAEGRGVEGSRGPGVQGPPGRGVPRGSRGPPVSRGSRGRVPARGVPPAPLGGGWVILRRPTVEHHVPRERDDQEVSVIRRTNPRPVDILAGSTTVRAVIRPPC